VSDIAKFDVIRLYLRQQFPQHHITDFQEGTSRAQVFRVEPDKPAKLGPITIEGEGSLPEASIRRALDLHEGAAYSTTDLEDARRAALDLGVLSSVEIVPVLATPPPEPRVVPIRVKVTV